VNREQKKTVLSIPKREAKSGGHIVSEYLAGNSFELNIRYYADALSAVRRVLALPDRQIALLSAIMSVS
jgi:hypothetical protein